ncbi:BapA/Bap/LapF family large adhesin [Pseudomonas sp. NPDC090201]|uniref:BapA/Bap/LapF family large adhesin n=1 Tax=Pseudomonas sp. NPDC090201 TaxID=3364475 RepID=UPI0037F38717
MENVVVADKATSQIDAHAWGDLQLKNPAVVQMPVSPDKVASVSRSGQDLVVNLKNGEHIKVANFFTPGPDGVASDMVFQGEDGALWQAQYNAQAFEGFTFEEISSIDELIAGTGVVSGATSAWAIAGLGLLGAGGAAAVSGGGGGGGGGGSGTPGDTTAPDAPTSLLVSANGLMLSGLGEAGARVTVRDASGNILGSGTVGSDGRFEIPLNAPQTNGQNLNVTLTDAAGNTSAPGTATAGDTTAPDAPSNLQVDGTGTHLSGTGEPGATIQVRAPDGTLIASGVVAGDGTFNLTLNPPQANGQTLTVTATDPAGNTSASGTATAGDTTAPDAPANLLVDGTGTHLTGTGEPGATIQVRGADGTLLGSGVVAADGTFNLTLSPAQANGQTLTVTATDAAGNTSTPGTATAGDTTAPDAPANLLVDATGTHLTGTGEPGATIQVRAADGTLLGSGVVAADGTFNLTLDPAQVDGQTLSVTATDATGNVSGAAQALAPDLDNPGTPDQTPPDAPTDLAISNSGTLLTGHGEVGARVTVIDANGNVLGTAVVGADGSFQVTLSPAQVNGEVLQVSLTDAANNTSPNVAVQAHDTTPPVAPSDLSISADGLTLTGLANPGVRILIRNASGTVIGVGRADVNGHFSVTLSSPQINGEHLDVVTTDAAGNSSAPVEVTAPDTVPPGQVTDVVISADGTQISGKGEPLATITITSGGVTVTTVVAANGTFQTTLSPAVHPGDVVQITQSDAQGNHLPPVSVIAPDAVGPATPGDLALSPDGTHLTGTGTPGSLIEVRDANGTVIASATVAANGTFDVTFNPPQITGATLDVVAVSGGEDSVSVPVVTPDATPPAIVSDLAVSNNGLTLTGRGEPGATVTVKDAQGNVLGTAVVGQTGSFSATLSSAQTNGQTLSVLQTDAAGNASPTTTVNAADLDGPLQPTNLSIGSNGTVLSGLGEAGSRITVRDSNGNVLGTAIVAADGHFNVTLSSPQNNGQTLSISAVDSAGNAAPVLPYITPDTQAPAPLTGLALDSQGRVLTGNGEAGASITVRSPSGAIIGTGTVGSDGHFTLTLTTAQVDSQVLQVTQADPAGNVSQPSPVTAPDLTVPDSVTNVTISANGQVVTGNGQIGATVTVNDASGNSLGTAVVGANGRFEVNLSSAQINGQNLSVTQADGSPGTSTPVPVIAPDLQAPVAPTQLTLNAAGNELSGVGEPGATVHVYGPNGALLGTAVVDGTGAFTVSLSGVFNDGQVLVVNQTDAAQHVSPNASLTAPDTTPPPGLTGVGISSNGATVTGNGQAGDTVTVKDASGTVLGTAVVAANGTFSVTLTPAQLDGQVLSVTQTDASTLPSPVTNVTAPDVTAPAVPSGLSVDDTGTIVSGTAQIGSTVQVFDANGQSLGTVVVGQSGTFTLTLPTPLTNGEALQVVATDGTNTSVPAPVNAPDTTPPPPVGNLAINPTGTSVSGTGEAGTTITVQTSTGTILGTGTVGSNGVFVVTLTTPAANGSSLQVISTDAAGNDSTPSPLTGPDGTQVATPSSLVLSSDGFTLTGAGTPGSTITITGNDGSPLGTGVVNSAGRFNIRMAFAQINAQTLHVTASDADGHTSVPGTIVAADNTPPDALTQLTINGNGTVVSGRGEAGATVSITNAAGTVLGTGVVASDGSFNVTLNAAQIDAQALTATQRDPAGNPSQPATVNAPDLTAPAAATGVTINNVGTVVSGQGEAGATVTVRDAAGNVLATGTVDQSGNFQVTLPSAQNTGAPLHVTLTDAAGNTSADTPLNTVDKTPPAAVQVGVISPDGSTVSGTGEAGATVKVTDANGTLLGSAVVGSDGNFIVTLNPAPNNGQTLDISQTDPSGNVSPSVTVDAPDITPPAALTQVSVNADGATVIGHGEPGATVTVRSADGTLLGTGLVASNGSFSLTLNPPQLNAQVLTVTQEDPPGNVSTAVTVISVDHTAPDSPLGLTLNPAGLQLSGTAEAGSTVTVRDAAGNVLGTGTTAADGTFQLVLNSPQLNGQNLSVTATDAAGNVSPAAAFQAGDSTPPAAVANLAISADGVTLAGSGEVGATVVVRDASGNQLGTGTVGSNGNFSLTLTPAAGAGTSVTVIQTDAAGNASPSATVTAPGSLAEPAPTQLSLSADGLTLTGTAHVGSTVTVRSASGTVLGTALVGSDGTFSVTLGAAQLNGEHLSASATSSDGINSLSTAYTAADVTAPSALSNLVLAADGLALTGRGEAGATVTVTGGGGVTLGTAVVAANGTFSLNLNAAQTAGQQLHLSQTDPSGNESPSVNLIAPDLVAPLAPAALAITSDGTVLSGTGEAGATVNVYNPSGALVGTGSVRIDGSFSITLTTPQNNGQLLSVTLTDASGNTSLPGSLTTVDTTAPLALTQLAISSDGQTLTGHGEAGARVTVTDSSGNALGNVLVGSTGTFTLVLTNPLTNAQVLTLVQTDAAGNVSPVASLVAPDTTAPDQLNNVAINASGLLVTGTGEAGATVTVKDAAGNVLGTSVVLANGSFSVTLNAPQLNHQVLSVQQADPPGNISAPVTVTAPDLTPPQTATNLLLNATGSTLTGNGEPDAIIRVTLANGTVIGTGSVGANGSFLINLTQAQHNGEQVFVVLTDAAGNASVAGSLIAPDTTPPAAVAQLAVDNTGLILTGTGEAGAQLLVTNAAGTTLGTGTVGADGRFTVTLTQAQLNGEVLSVVQRDGAGNPSLPATVTAIDHTPPAPPAVTALTSDGLTLTGTGEIGALVRVTSASGAVLGTATVGADGTFSVSLSSAQLNGQVLSLTQTDVATNRSDVATYTVADVTDPLPVTGLAVSQNGLVLTGNGEAGAHITVTSSTGTLLGSGTVNANGTFSVSLSSAQLNGQVLTVVQVDAANNDSTPVPVTAPDTTPPLIPASAVLSAGGTILSGTAEANSTVTVTSAAGVVLGTGQANASGQFQITLSSAQTNGQLLSVVATDGANNHSPVLVVTAPDTTAPALVTNLTINAAHTQLVGRGEAGATVVVTQAGLTVGTGVVAADGTFTINLTSTIPSTQVLNVVQTDASDNHSLGVNFTVPSLLPPDAPTQLALSAGGLTLTGAAAAGTTITVYGAGGAVLGTGTTGAGGTFTVTLSSAQANGQSLQVTATATTGEISLPTGLIAPDTTPPAPLTELAINATGTLVTGRGEVGATVTINAPGGAVLGTAVVGANGTFSALLTTPQANGQILSAHQSDVAGNASTSLNITAPDITAPVAPTSLGINAAGLVLSGLGEAGATVTVRGASGVLGTALVAANGTFSVTLSAAQLNGQALTVTQADVAGNVSTGTAFTAPDTTPPAALSNLSLNAAGLLVAGTGEAGATVKVTNAAGTVLGTGVVNASGTFAITLNSAQLNGQVLNIQQSDPAGNLSPVGHLTAADIQAPLVPTSLALAANGLTLTGAGEAGATVNVYSATGVLLGTGQVGVTGTFNVTLNTAQLDGQALTVRLVDAANNVSAAGTLTAPDTTAPGAPTGVAVNASGTLLTGTGVAGSTVSVRTAAGLVLGTATVAANGTFSVALNTPQINNEVLNVTQADAAGNVSTVASATAPDLTPPVAATTLVVSGDGLSLSGNGEAGATVTVKSASGVVLGTGTVGGTGVFSVTLNAAQINGEKLVVSLTDPRGNVSVGANVTAPDIDANAPVTASDNLAVATVNITPATVVQNYTDSFSTLLAGFTKTYSFTVASGTTIDPTLTLTTSSLLNLLNGINYTLQVKNASGTWVTLDVNGNGGLLDLLGLGTTGLQVKMANLLSGDYRLVVSSSGVGLVTTVNTQLELDIHSLTQFNGTAGTPTTGNVITDVGTNGQVDQTGPDNGAVLQIMKGGSYVAAGAGTTVQGLYGTLTIDSSGHYSYTSNGSVGSVGKVDVFSYQLVHPNGLSSTANLYVRIDSPQATEIWNDSSLASPALLVDATDDIAHSSITLANKVDTSTTGGSFGIVLGAGSGSYNTTVAANATGNLNVVLHASNLLNLLGGLTVGLYKLNTTSGQYELVKSYAGNALLSIGGGDYGINFTGQAAGSYQVRVAVSGVSLLTTVTTTVTNTATYSNQFVVGSYTPVSGNLLTDTAGGGVDVLGSPYTVLSVLLAGTYVTPGYNGTTLTGTYGSLLVHADGSYIYTLNAGSTSAVVGHQDTFTYQLTHPNGTTDTATLVVTLDQASAVTATTFSSLSAVEDHSALVAVGPASSAELIQGTAGNDTLDGSHGGAVTLNGGAGNDTLIIADQHFASVDGGTGTDTLLWAGGDAAINLGDLQSRIHNIEILDLNTTSAVSLTLNLSDVLAITSSDNNTLVIKGDSKDSVHMTDTWTADTGTHQIDGIGYTQYTPTEDPNHHLWVQNGIHVV